MRAAFRYLDDLPIRRKLTLLVLLSSGVGLLVAGAALIGYTWQVTRSDALRDLQTLADITADHATAALAFSDRDAAAATLAALKAKPEVRLACLYDVAGEPFTHYAAHAAVCPPRPPAHGLHEGSAVLLMVARVTLRGEQIGTLLLSHSLEPLRRALATQVLIVIGIFALSFLLSAAAAWLMQRAITAPLLRLAHTAQKVSATRDYSLRVPPAGADEVGQLIETFNQMMAQIGLGEAALRESSVRIRTIVETAVDGIIAIDARGIVEAFNVAAERIFGYAAEEVLGRNVRMLMPAPFHDEHDGYIANYLQTGLRKVIGIGREVTGRRKDGSTFPMELAVSEMRIGRERKFTGLVRDITERKHAEAEMQRLNQSLERQVAETRLALEKLRQMQGQLVQSEKLASLGALVAGVAHEINTPVGVGVSAASTLHALAEELRQRYQSGTLARADLEQFLQNAQLSADLVLNNLQRAADLIHSFKQVAVDQSSGECRVFGLKKYLDDVIVSLSPRLKHTPHRVRVLCPPDLTVQTYPGALAQIVTNLVSNSLVHGYDAGQSGQIEIAVAQAGGEVTLRYRDDGRGVPAEHAAKIFDPFFTTRRGSGGSGLGLHIVYNLVTQRLGGTIRLVSAAPRGAEFVIRFPAAACKAAA